jgi:general secretion pathway protein M
LNTKTLSESPALASLKQQAFIWWRARTPRERQAVTVVVGVLLLIMVWSWFIQPALRTLREAPIQLAQLEAQYQRMQQVAVESNSLRGSPRVGQVQAVQALKAATERLGDQGKLALQGERATLTLTNASPEALRTWLVEARAGARTKPVEAQLLRAAQGYNGTLSVALGGAP